MERSIIIKEERTTTATVTFIIIGLGKFFNEKRDAQSENYTYLFYTRAYLYFNVLKNDNARAQYNL